LKAFPLLKSIIIETIREGDSWNKLEDEVLVDLVCSSTHNLLATLLQLLDDDESFGEAFIELTKPRGRTISICLHPTSAVPFTRVREDAVSPTLELYLPQLTGKELEIVLKDMPKSCGKDLTQVLKGLSEFDPLRSTEVVGGPLLPQVKDLPRPAMALSRGPLYIRIFEDMGASRSTGFRVEGYPPVVNLLQEYIWKHASNHYAMDFTCWARPHRLARDVKVLRISSSSSDHSMTALSIVGLLEGTLGFQRVGEPLALGTDLIWLFQRAEAFTVL